MNIGPVTVDFDSTVITREGRQQVGLVRADSGFYTEKTLNCLEARELNYIIAVRCYSNIKRSIYGLKDWVEICDGIEV
jgi:transposase